MHLTHWTWLAYIGHRYTFTLPYENLQIGYRLHEEGKKLKKIKKLNSENDVSMVIVFKKCGDINIVKNPAAEQAVRQFKSVVVCHSEFISESRIFSVLHSRQILKQSVKQVQDRVQDDNYRAACRDRRA